MAFRFRRILAGSRAGQRGVYDLVSLGIGATIVVAFATVGLWEKRQEMLSEQMSAQGGILLDIGNLVNGKYLALYYSNLVNGTAIPGVANEYAPTMAELKAINVIPAGFSTTSAYGFPYQVSLSKVPAGCIAPACDIAGNVYIGGAITDPSTGKPLTLADGAAAIGGDGGYSDTITPGTLTGMNGSWTDTNPVGNVAGVLAMRVGYGSSGWSAFVRRDGSLPMEGDLNFQGTTGTLHNIANAATVNAQKVVTPGGNSVQIGNSFLYGDGSNSAIRQNGALYVQNTAGTAPADVNVGSVNASGNVNANGTIWSNGQITTNSNVYLASNAATVIGGGQLNVNANGPLYLNPWSGGQTIVGGGGGSGQLVVAGRLFANEYIQPNGWASQGAGCSPNGLIATSGSGPLFCQNGVWTAPGGGGSAVAYCKSNSCGITLPSAGTWDIFGVAYSQQSAWAGATFTINGAVVDTNGNWGDQAGTGYGVMSGAYRIAVGGPTYIPASTSWGSAWGDFTINLHATKE
ncbi:TPA: shufflon system plasmid conjugative transfer pilus tip adhesin PilV [Burkholderia vietnamiensis]|uniref:shufflon system plasmid conjugative transfer pilus tip adhesin PilV n=1 Tax=Burkholderia vietnamiensis TaxID=60552 RepID=UPI00298B64FD|nr:shufflon system plasmid conjugative transfer pilus tip adhesin PilV [Burkholderia vietnamiensis]